MRQARRKACTGSFPEGSASAEAPSVFHQGSATTEPPGADFSDVVIVERELQYPHFTPFLQSAAFQNQGQRHPSRPGGGATRNVQSSERQSLPRGAAHAAGWSCFGSLVKSVSDPEPDNDTSSMEKPVVDSVSDVAHVVGEMELWSSAGKLLETELWHPASQQGAASNDGSCSAADSEGGRAGGNDAGQMLFSIGGSEGGNEGAKSEASDGGGKKGAGDAGPNGACHGGPNGAGEKNGAGGGRDAHKETSTEGCRDDGFLGSSGASHDGGNAACRDTVTDAGCRGGGGGLLKLGWFVSGACSAACIEISNPGGKEGAWIGGGGGPFLIVAWVDESLGCCKSACCVGASIGMTSSDLLHACRSCWP